MKTLILGTCYISEAQEGAQNYGAKLVELWAKLNHKLNPDMDILLVDSCSPVGPLEIGNITNFRTFLMLDEQGNSLHDSLLRLDHRGTAHMPDNIGHINVTGRDGWGRAFCAGVKLAIKFGYDYLAYCDADIICTQPVQPIIEKMHRAGVKAACPWDSTYSFCENGLMYLSVPYLRASNFIERYSWETRTRTNDPKQIPEMVFEQLMGDDLFILPMRGLRDDSNRLTVNNLPYMFPYGVNFLTHVRDFNVYLKFLEMQGITL